MVRRLALTGLAAALALAAAVPSRALAVSHKVAIGDFKWSSPVVNVDLGEHVTWFWVGPDTEHSVTGISTNDENLDSDPDRAVPVHRAGDKFSLTLAATIDAELYRLRAHGARAYASYMLSRGHVGYDDVAFPARTHGGHRLRAGRYVAIVRATDAAHNDSPPRRLRFTVR